MNGEMFPPEPDPTGGKDSIDSSPRDDRLSLSDPTTWTKEECIRWLKRVSRGYHVISSANSLTSVPAQPVSRFQAIPGMAR